MGSKSSSKTSNYETNTQLIETENLNLSDFEGFGVAGNEGDVDISVTTSDYGAIVAAGEVSSDALASNRYITDAALNVAGDVSASAIRAGQGYVSDSLDFADDFADGAFDFAERTVERTGEVTQDVLNRAYAFGEDAIAAVLQTSGKAIALSGETVDKAVAVTRSDSADVLNNITKYGAVAVGLIVFAVLVSKG